MAYIPSCPFCFHTSSFHLGELYCSNSIAQEKKNTSAHCIKVLEAKKIEETAWHQTRLTLRVVQHGSERFVLPDKELLLHPGRFLILNDGQHYKTSIESESPVQSLTVAFQKGFAESLLAAASTPLNRLLDNPYFGTEQKVTFCETIYEDSKVSSLLTSLVSGLSNKEQDSSLEDLDDFFQETLEAVLQHTHQAYKGIERIQSCKAATRKELYRRLCLARECIEAQFTTKLTLEQLSQTAHLSVPYLKRAFKEYYQLTPHALIVRRRLQQARQLLQSTDLPVQHIAEEVGFENSSSFIRLFKSTYHHTPAALRARRKN
jgi:AraC family transcriptional regulator